MTIMFKFQSGRSFFGTICIFLVIWLFAASCRTSEAFTSTMLKRRLTSIANGHGLKSKCTHKINQDGRSPKTQLLAGRMATTKRQDLASTTVSAKEEEETKVPSAKIPRNLPPLAEVLSSTRQSSPEVTSNGKATKRKHNKGKDQSRHRRPFPSSDQRRRNQQKGENSKTPLKVHVTSTRPLETRGPWLASYATSRQTQQKIQSMGGDLTRRWAPLRRAAAVLNTLLETPPEHCNSANLVCALTLSAKLRGDENERSTTTPSGRPVDHNHHEKATVQLRHLLWKALGILRDRIAADELSGRQLCNAAWAIAKHFDRDPLLLPAFGQQAPLSSTQHFGMAETWTLPDNVYNDDNQTSKGASNASQQDDADLQSMVNLLVDELALNLACKLQSDPWIAKEGELCMACWAFGILRQRRRPAGWKMAPQLGSVQTARSQNSEKAQRRTRQKQEQRREREQSMAITFEQWQAPLHQHGEECMDLDPPGPTDELLDQISLALCQPSKQPSRKSESHKTTSIRLQACRWSELAHVAWAHASHGLACSAAAEGVLLALASEASLRLHNPVKGQRPLSRDMAQLVWSFGILQSDNFRLTCGLMELLKGVAAYTHFQNPTIERPFADWSCPDIVQVPLALAHARVDDQELLRELYTEAVRRIKLSSTSNTSRGRHLHAWEISILLWAQARLHLTEDQGDIFEEFPTVAIEALLFAADQEGGWDAIGIGGQEQANVIWSMTVLEKYHTSKEIRLLQDLFLASQQDCRETGIIQLEHAHQLWQALFLLEDDAPRAVEGVQPWFRDALEAKWLREKSRPKVSSARHRALSKVLSDMGVAHFNEHDEDIDVAIVLKRAASWTHETHRMSLDVGVRVAVEFDGPNHFTRILDEASREAPRPLGHSILKYRLLKRQGWTVVRVPYYEFDRIPFWASMERQRYLQRLLKTHSDLRFSSVDVSEYSPPVANRLSRFQ